MSVTAIVHVNNEEPIMCEMDEIPQPTDQVVKMINPRRPDGKEVFFLDENVSVVLMPWHRINLVQVMPSAEVEDIIGFVRE
jgi:hypothetical protein